MYYNILYSLNKIIYDMKSWFNRCTTGIFYKKRENNQDNGYCIIDENGENYIRLYDEIWDL